MSNSTMIDRLSRAAAVLAVFGLALVAAPRASAQTPANGPQTYFSALTHATVSNPTPTQTVITMQATGDLWGLLTITANHASGSMVVTSASWALAVDYAQYLPMTSDAPSDDPDAQPMVLINEGTLGGTVTGATLVTGAGGQITGLSGAQLFIVSGSLQFNGVAGGGSLQATGFADFATSSGTLSLNF
jgi:hypothetical protein